MLVERVVFIRRRALEFESAAMAGKPLPFEYGAYFGASALCALCAT